MKILFVIDKIEFKYFEFNKLVTSFWLIMEFLRRGHEVFITTQERLFLEADIPKAEIFKINLINKDNDFDIVMEKSAFIDKIENFKVVFFRPDPPVDIDYINSTYILDYVDKSKTFVINNPSSIRSANEKLYINNFQSIIPKNITTASNNLIRKFLEENGEIIIKPLNRCFSSGVFYLKTGDKNVHTIIETATNKGQTVVMVQKYLPQIESGDKRLVFIDGEIFDECVTKIHGEDDFKFNTHEAQYFKKGILSEKEKQIQNVIAQKMLDDGLYIAGLDVIDGTVIEINVTSPCFFIKEVNELFGIKFEQKIVDKLEALILKH